MGELFILVTEIWETEWVGSWTTNPTHLLSVWHERQLGIAGRGYHYILSPYIAQVLHDTWQLTHQKAIRSQSAKVVANIFLYMRTSPYKTITIYQHWRIWPTGFFSYISVIRFNSSPHKLQTSSNHLSKSLSEEKGFTFFPKGYPIPILLDQGMKYQSQGFLEKTITSYIIRLLALIPAEGSQEGWPLKWKQPQI